MATPLVTFLDRLSRVTAEEIEALRADINASTLGDDVKKSLLDNVSRKEELSFFLKRLNAVGAEETKALRVEIRQSELSNDEKNDLLVSLNEKELKSFGNFFTLIDELFVNDDETYEHADFAFYESCCRSRYRAQKDKANVDRENRKRKRENNPLLEAETTMAVRSGAGGGGTNDVYKITFDSAEAHAQAATNAGQSRTSTHNRVRQTLWLTNVVGQPHSKGMQIAHLVPASAKDADSYWFVADFLFGVDGRRDWGETQRLIHGANHLKGDKMEKVENSGIKHMVTNKLLLASQADYLDATPCVIIVPILSRQGEGVNALNWSGEGYDAIMLIDSYVNDDTETQFDSSPLEQVAQKIGFTHLDPTKENRATPEEVEMAMNLVRDYTRAIYYAQDRLKTEQVVFSMHGDNGAGLFFPRLPTGYQNLNIRKISFESHASDVGHPAPDPLLLLSKDIAVLQARHHFRIVVAAEPREDILLSDSSVQAEEAFLRYRERIMMHRDPLGMDIVVG